MGESIQKASAPAFTSLPLPTHPARHHFRKANTDTVTVSHLYNRLGQPLVLPETKNTSNSTQSNLVFPLDTAPKPRTSNSVLTRGRYKEKETQLKTRQKKEGKFNLQLSERGFFCLGVLVALRYSSNLILSVLYCAYFSLCIFGPPPSAQQRNDPPVNLAPGLVSFYHLDPSRDRLRPGRLFGRNLTLASNNRNDSFVSLDSSTITSPSSLVRPSFRCHSNDYNDRYTTSSTPPPSNFPSIIHLVLGYLRSCFHSDDTIKYLDQTLVR